MHPSTAPLPPALPGERLVFDSPAGPLAAYLSGQGAPLLLVHSVNAAASAAEVAPIYAHYANPAHQRTVLALDLPGYGHSQRGDRAYSPRMMTDALLAAVAQLQQRCGPGPVDALALSLSCEFLARAASEHPHRFRSLALVSPTGFSGRSVWRAPAGSTRGMPWLLTALRGPGNAWGGALFRGLTRPAVVRYFLRRTWGGPNIDETMAVYAMRTAREPGAEFAPLHFLSAGLFSADIHTVYESLRQPVWVTHGVRGDFTDYRQLTLVNQRPHWQINQLPTGALPHFEVPAQFFALYDQFLAQAGPQPA